MGAQTFVKSRFNSASSRSAAAGRSRGSPAPGAPRSANPRADVVFRLPRRSGRLAHFQLRLANCARPSSYAVAEPSTSLCELFLPRAVLARPKMIRWFFAWRGRTLDREPRLAELRLALRELALHSVNLVDKGLDDIAHVVQLSTCQITVAWNALGSISNRRSPFFTS